MNRRQPRSTLSSSSAASDVYKRQYQRRVRGKRFRTTMGSKPGKPETDGAPSEQTQSGPRSYGREAALYDLRLPAFITQGSMSPEVLAYLHQAPLFSMSEDELIAVGFDRCVDHPNIPDHIYYEGYRYAATVDHPLQTMHPRKGGTMTRSAAPKELRAFLEAVRQVNRELFSELRLRLLEHFETHGSGASELLAKCIDEGRHFADCSVQIHSGSEVPAEAVGWHVDAPNSALHLAVSVRGSRALHANLAETADLKAAVEGTVQWQHPGDLYAGCPATFNHGVQYQHAEWCVDDAVA
eukprot:TRINITY_DN10003_c0_g1_i7.p1 TRINITY_DN10003_c0_g1~~TRINITY_DN10003_c0_g1_i7.p1  ORF type:complete len:296 (-),score=53.02 TRINITY_DN10003_c0_g1_i7:614-1501(-)